MMVDIDPRKNVMFIKGFEAKTCIRAVALVPRNGRCPTCWLPSQIREESSRSAQMDNQLHFLWPVCVYVEEQVIDRVRLNAVTHRESEWLRICFIHSTLSHSSVENRREQREGRPPFRDQTKNRPDVERSESKGRAKSREPFSILDLYAFNLANANALTAQT